MLSILRTKRRIRDFLTYDLEWVPGTMQVRLVGCYDGERYRRYPNVERFLDAEMTSSNRGKWFYAHAGGLADIQFVFEHILSSGDRYDVQASFSGSSAIICNVKRGKNVWHFVDSFWLFRDSLAAIGNSIGIAKTGPKALEGATEDDVRSWYAEVSMDELEPYNENDCRILWHAIDRFEDTLLQAGGQLQMTIASCAMQLFRRRYLTADIGTHQLVNEIGRKAYFASRVEVLESTCGEANYYDINSSFPYAMTQPVPGEFLRSTRKLPSADELYIADVTITVPESFIPPIPLRSRGKLYFPHGTWRSWLSSVDVHLLEREGGIIERVHDVLIFAPSLDLRDYALDIYARRKAASDPFDKLVYKYLLNSLYGKFAERPEKEKLHVHPSEATWSRWNRTLDRSTIDEMMLLPGVFVETVKVGIQHEHVPISVFITARARQTIYDCLTQSRDTYYCDTDGFATSDEYETSSELGGLKLEKVISKGRFVAPKVYGLDGKVLTKNGFVGGSIVKAKGFSLGRSGSDGLSSPTAIERFESLLEGESIKIERMSRLREELSRTGRKSVLFTPREATIKKRLLLDGQTKRYMYPDGKTRPWHVSEIDI